MAAIAFSDKVWGVIDNKRVVEVTVTPSTSYLQDGTTEVVNAQTVLGLKQVDFISVPTTRLNDSKVPTTAADTKRGFTVTAVVTDPTAVQLHYWATSGTELADAQNLSAAPFRIRFHGS